MKKDIKNGEIRYCICNKIFILMLNEKVKF